VDASNAALVVGGLLAREKIYMIASYGTPPVKMLATKELVEAVHEELDLIERVLGQTFVFPAELQVLSRLWKGIDFAHRWL
jgi:hypothetical protein